MKTITIKGKSYNVKYTLRALFIFEQITKKAFEIKTLLDNYIFFYSVILANNEDVLDWNDFIDELDENPNLFNEMNDEINNANKVNDIIGNDESEEDSQKKS